MNEQTYINLQIDRNEWIDLYLNHKLSTQQIAESYYVARQTVSAFLTKAGIVMRKKGPELRCTCPHCGKDVQRYVNKKQR